MLEPFEFLPDPGSASTARRPGHIGLSSWESSHRACGPRYPSRFYRAFPRLAKGYDGPMGTYTGDSGGLLLGAARTPVRPDLRLVGKIRNRFAHDLSLSFADPQISSWCEAIPLAPRRLHRPAP